MYPIRCEDLVPGVDQWVAADGRLRKEPDEEEDEEEDDGKEDDHDDEDTDEGYSE